MPTIRSEEGYLREHFAGFDEYAAKVPRLLPRLTAARFPANENASGGGFTVAQWRHHREYNALMGAGAIYSALAVRLYLNHHGVMQGSALRTRKPGRNRPHIQSVRVLPFAET